MIDGYIGEIYSIYKSAGVLDDTLFMVTADHGGIENTHGGDSPEEMNVFFGAAGHSVNDVMLEKICIQDIPAILCYALGARGSETWESRVPKELFK